jgi:hypothetical protein
MKAFRLAGSALLVGALFASGARAEDAKGSTWDSWYNVAIQYGYTWSASNDIILGYGSDSDDRHQVRLEFENIWKYGENYIFVDGVGASTNLGGERPSPFGPLFGDGKDSELYGVINSNLSAQKILGLERGLFDVALEGRAEFGTFFNYDAYAVGASLYVNLPGFVSKPGDKIQLTYWHRWNDDNFASNGCFFGSPCVTFTENRYADHDLLGLTIRKEWEMFNTRWQHQTFLRVQLEEPGNASEVQRFNRVFWESEIFAYLTKNLSIGFRSEYFWDDGGIDKDATTFAVTDKSDWRPIIAIKYDLGSSD